MDRHLVGARLAGGRILEVDLVVNVVARPLV